MSAKNKGGGVYHRGSTWWLRYWWHGEQQRESAETDNKKVALQKLKKRLEDMHNKTWAGPQEDNLTLDDALERIRADYIQKKNCSFKTAEYCFKYLREGFPFYRVVDITADKIEAYQGKRLDEEAARSTVNRELAYLRHGLRLMHEKGEISRMPVIKLLGGENVRKGFIDVPTFGRILENIPDADVRDVVAFLYNSGWRSREAMDLRWADVDIPGKMIRLRAEASKNKEARSLPIVGALADVMERRQAARRLDCVHVFHRQGKAIKSIRRIFTSAVTAVGLPGLIPHDMRRSAIRNFRKAGLSPTEGMKLSGHKTDSVYRRYDIIDEQDLTESMTKVQEHVERERQSSNVVPLLKRVQA
ncbi:MAG: site-specific integrase [Deltaproteobacteria bacterium]|nr:site-specific integrase [Deltaproteobacteria bacterium]